MRRKNNFYGLLVGLFVGILIPACQKAPELTLSGPSSIELSADGSSGSITFTANRDWTASASDSWVSISPSSGKASDGTITVSVRCNANTTYDDRTATVTIRMEELSQSVTVRQLANKGVVLPKQVYDLQSDAKTIDVEVQANVQYTVSTSVNWIKQTGTKGLTSRTLTFSIEENKTYDPREGKITIKPQEGNAQEQVISVKQAQKDALNVEKTSYNMPYGGGEIEIKVESNVSFDVTPNADWIHYVQTKALSNSTVVLKIDENATYSSRQGTIEIKQQNGSLKHTITINQAGRIAVTSVVLDKTSLKLNVSDSETLVATVKPDNATDKTVTWTSSDDAIATVDETGKVTAVKEGSATITAKAGEKTAECKVTVYVAVTSVELNKTTLSIIEGESETLTATVKPDNATDKTVTWTSSDEKIATVKDGKVTAVKVGEATITATVGDKTAECKVTVSPVPVSSVTLDHTSLDLEIGETATLVATVKPDNAADKTVTWSSSDTMIATVDASGEVTAVGEGEATITAEAGDKTAECKVIVKRVPVSSVNLDKTTLALRVGEAVVLTATVDPDNATDKSIIWRTDDEGIAKVDDTGKVTAIQEGVAIVTATAGDKSAECKVTVKKTVPKGAVDLGVVVSREDGSTYELFWADCNLGADKPEEYGDYYAWGELETKSSYWWGSYQWANARPEKLTKYCPIDQTDYWDGEGSPDGKIILEIGDDVVSSKLGNNWRMPSKAEYDALLGQCTWSWTTKNGVDGYEVISKVEGNTNSIFLPAAGYKELNGNLRDNGYFGYYWCTSLFGAVPSNAYALYIYWSTAWMSNQDRSTGRSVRPVIE